MWGNYSAAKRLKKLGKISEEIADGDMPPWYYVYPAHMDARLSDADLQAVNYWIASERDALKQIAGQARSH